MIMPFGKFAGERLDDLPEDYLGWLLTLPDLTPWLRQAVEDQLHVQDRPDWLPSAARVLPALILRWQDAMLARWPDDLDARRVICDGLSVLRSLAQNVADDQAAAEPDPTGLPDEYTPSPLLDDFEVPL